MIPYGKQNISEDDINAVVKVLRSDFLTQGPVVPKFEEELCNYTGAKHAVAVNSCTSALHIACLSLGLEPGGILWTSPITFVASANCALYCGASVDLVDIDFDTALMSISHLKSKLERAKKDGKLPKIVVPVHFSGQSCDMQEIHSLSKEYGFYIVEDAAHAIGGSYKDEKIGCCKYSDITVFSFHPVKIITTGEGGAALTNNSKLAKNMELLRSHGITRDIHQMNEKSSNPWYYEQITLGYNYRMTDIQAALGVSQLNIIDEYISKRAEIANYYDKVFRNTKVFPLIVKTDRSSSNHLYVIRVSKKIRNILFDKLIEAGIGVNLHYIPLYKQPYFELNGTFSEAEKYYSSAISIPIFPLLPVNKVRYIANTILSLLETDNECYE
ncbi:UDP-4-amino-4,6-dideoxy-N-acetyl-beta-L-altrosamine transaminase [bacterium]|nr:UDP-4-amino-4,6-dideoxy-N-acetyl-beta-L-altrosamine transaminase [bacterium]